MNKRVKFIYLLAFAILGFASCNSPKNKSKKSVIDQKVDSLLSVMTLEEKIGQMNLYNGFWDATGPKPKNGNAAKKYQDLKNGLVGAMLNVRGVKNVKAVQKIAVEETRLGIPLIIGFDVIHGHKTLAPIPLAEAASWDLEAIKTAARNAAVEASAEGINWTFAPMVDISRDARWGRVMEGAGEDTYLASLIAKARVEGFQGEDLSAHNTIAACAKHFAAYGFAEAGRDYNTTEVNPSTLRNTILPPFKAAKDAGVKTFMNAFNDADGIPATGSQHLQRTILKEEWGFNGFVVSDWGSIKEMIAHGYAKDNKHAAEIAAKAGSDMDMESYAYVKHLAGLVKDGKVKEAYINQAAARILKVKFELGLFDDPYKYCDEAREKEVLGSKELHAGVLDMAKKSMVLLKNSTNLLPLKKQGLNIAVIGDLADDKTSPLGSWRLAAEDNTAISVLEGLKAYPNNNITFASGPKLYTGTPTFVKETQINTTDKSGFNEAVRTARNKDVVIMVLGEHGFQSGEGRSRVDLGLPSFQQQLLEAVYEVNKNIVLVLMNGRPLTINWADANIPSILEAWQLGTQSGNAIAQVLYGDYNPSGKLPMTFPKHVGQVPIYYNHKSTGRPKTSDHDANTVFWSHYGDISNDPLYEFGYGLSYTTFTYDNLKLSAKSCNKKGNIKVTFTLKNSGNYRGKEVVQLYIQDLYASIIRPVKELKGFKIVDLKAGESKKVSFTIDAKTLEFYSANNKWEAEVGEFKVFVGGSSKTNIEDSFELTD
ncbi:beta-glucosidase BglX [uncultured Polaribacter sp.]|uniref:beta-glucosidase BglX n=1 Tax=uncultured Polaribacter sp. TaxID=174711 RepID=UPI002623C087|nr:beta-glucosidase BglX [uncultured Polaribacter sp.]